MKDFKFNTLYIIESLKEGEPKTGKSLYDDVRLQQFMHEGLVVQFNEINSAAEWDNLMSDILRACQTIGELPILHLEIHGREQGVEFKDKSFRTIEQVGEQFRRINIATGCNLFITMGVCKGLYVLFETHIDKPMPFCGAIGSFEKMSSYDIQLRYAEFYGTFFRTFDITQAYIQLMKVETAVSEEYTQYRYIHIDEVFYKSYMRYIKEQCNKDIMPKRALDAATKNNYTLRNRTEKRQFQQKFAKFEKLNRTKYYQEAVNAFFMLDKYPENKERFDIPITFKELEEKCKHLVTV